MPFLIRSSQIGLRNVARATGRYRCGFLAGRHFVGRKTSLRILVDGLETNHSKFARGSRALLPLLAATFPDIAADIGRRLWRRWRCIRNCCPRTQVDCVSPSSFLNSQARRFSVIESASSNVNTKTSHDGNVRRRVVLRKFSICENGARPGKRRFADSQRWSLIIGDFFRGGR